jgi:3-phosphoshikimate 1-carboxyvinyltransferase
MIKFVKPSKVKGTIKAPSSKSDMLRAVVAAYLTGERCKVLNPSFCDDAKAALGIVETLGVRLDKHPEKIVFTPLGVRASRLPHPLLDCGESGLCVRMFPSIAALLDDEVTLTGRGSLISRPIAMIEQPLWDLGVECKTQGGFLPVTIKGPLRAGTTAVDGAVTSQFLTGLLMALPLCVGESEIVVHKLTSKPYIEMTLTIMKTFGVEVHNENFERFIIKGPQKYKAISYNVEGDWSGAAFPLVGGAIAGSIRVENLNLASCQADKAIIDVLKLAGAKVGIGENYVEVQSADLSGFEFDATDCPDLFPPLVALASYCQGKSVIHGAQRLKVKESDRGNALLNEFTRIGASVKLYENRMEMTGKNALEGGTVDAHNDHRIAMACAVAALRSRQGVTINGWECVAKSYPEFFEDLTRLQVA